MASRELNFLKELRSSLRPEGSAVPTFFLVPGIGLDAEVTEVSRLAEQCEGDASRQVSLEALRIMARVSKARGPEFAAYLNHVFVRQGGNLTLLAKMARELRDSPDEPEIVAMLDQFKAALLGEGK